MNGYGLTAAIVTAMASLGWPLAVFGAIWLFRDKILELLPSLQLKYKDAEFSFRLAKAEKEAAALPPPPPSDPESEPTQEEVSSFEETARRSPRAAILEMRAELDETLRNFVVRHGLKASGMLAMARMLRNQGLITPEVSALLENVRVMGNSAAHQASIELTFSDAKRYRSLWELLMTQFGS